MSRTKEETSASVIISISRNKNSQWLHEFSTHISSIHPIVNTMVTRSLSAVDTMVTGCLPGKSSGWGDNPGSFSEQKGPMIFQ